MPERGSETDILSVSQLTHALRDLLEGAYPSVWVEGEISNFSAPASGHWYFTVKDEGASLSAAMFRGQNRRVRFRPEGGMSVLCHGRISVYPPRGNYQLIVDRIEPRGVGDLRLAFEQMRARLHSEGLFDESRKRQLPFLPVRVGIVTSPTGAAIRDMMRVLVQRYRPLEILLAPARVQGEGAAEEIAAALDLLDVDGRAQVVLCGRGGGSLEDLWAFNEETVARAIARCRIPVVSAVGHEVDVTIADLVADVRAATPSNAAELAVPVRAELDAALDDLRERLAQAAARDLDRKRALQQRLERHLIDPRRYLQIQAQRRDELEQRLFEGLERDIARRRERSLNALRRLRSASPAAHVRRGRDRLTSAVAALAQAQRHGWSLRQGALERTAGRLDALSPLGVLARGYAMASKDGRILREAGRVHSGDLVRVRLHRGELGCTVDEVMTGAAGGGDGEPDRDP